MTFMINNCVYKSGIIKSHAYNKSIDEQIYRTGENHSLLNQINPYLNMRANKFVTWLDKFLIDVTR